jgi:hypothetical protein
MAEVQLVVSILTLFAMIASAVHVQGQIKSIIAHNAGVERRVLAIEEGQGPSAPLKGELR